MSSLTEEDWDFLPACESNLLWYGLLVEEYECLALNWHWIRRGNVLSALFNNHVYFSLILHHNLKNGGF